MTHVTLIHRFLWSILFLFLFPAVSSAADFTGKWDTGFGVVTLTQTGNQVKGSYPHDNGNISGTVSGSVLTGTWSEAPTRKPPKDQGQFVFTLSSDQKTFSGKWRYGSSGGWKHDWNGTRIGPVPVKKTHKPSSAPVVVGMFGGKWDTGFGVVTLIQTGSQVKGSYPHDNGNITGTIKGNILTGLWSETPTRKPPNDQGQFVFTLSSGQKTFSGKWRYGSSGSWNHDWSGTRIGPVPQIKTLTSVSVTDSNDSTAPPVYVTGPSVTTALVKPDQLVEHVGLPELAYYISLDDVLKLEVNFSSGKASAKTRTWNNKYPRTFNVRVAPRLTGGGLYTGKGGFSGESSGMVECMFDFNDNTATLLWIHSGGKRQITQFKRVDRKTWQNAPGPADI